MNCPKCTITLRTTDHCEECGWTKAKKTDAPQRAQGVEDCAWIGDAHERCHYPGTIWRTTHGVGPGFCRFHVQEDCTAAYGAQVVIESRRYYPRTLAERDHDAVFGERTGTRACQERTCLITTRALPGKDFCRKHQDEFERPREPGDDDEEVAA